MSLLSQKLTVTSPWAVACHSRVSVARVGLHHSHSGVCHTGWTFIELHLACSFQMGRLLNCCGRRKKILLDLKESMLGPFMLLALRGDSSFIQVSGALLLKQIIIVDVICTVHRKSPVNNWTIVSGPWNSERNTCTCICTYQSQLLLLSFWLNKLSYLVKG